MLGPYSYHNDDRWCINSIFVWSDIIRSHLGGVISNVWPFRHHASSAPHTPTREESAI